MSFEICGDRVVMSINSDIWDAKSPFSTLKTFDNGLAAALQDTGLF